jgi:hypothetical protein
LEVDGGVARILHERLGSTQNKGLFLLDRRTGDAASVVECTEKSLFSTRSTYFIWTLPGRGEPSVERRSVEGEDIPALAQMMRVQGRLLTTSGGLEVDGTTVLTVPPHLFQGAFPVIRWLPTKNHGTLALRYVGEAFSLHQLRPTGVLEKIYSCVGELLRTASGRVPWAEDAQGIWFAFKHPAAVPVATQLMQVTVAGHVIRQIDRPGRSWPVAAGDGTLYCAERTSSSYGASELVSIPIT